MYFSQFFGRSELLTTQEKGSQKGITRQEFCAQKGITGWESDSQILSMNKNWALKNPYPSEDTNSRLVMILESRNP